MGDRTHWNDCWKERTHHDCAVARIYERDARIVELEAQRNRATYEVSSLLKELSALRARIAKLEAALNRANVELQRLHSGELPGGWTAALEAEVAARHKAKDALVLARTITDEQAEDEGLWFDAQTAPEAYLQRALRRLHAAVEGER